MWNIWLIFYKMHVSKCITYSWICYVVELPQDVCIRHNSTKPSCVYAILPPRLTDVTGNISVLCQCDQIMITWNKWYIIATDRNWDQMSKVIRWLLQIPSKRDPWHLFTKPRDFKHTIKRSLEVARLDVKHYILSWNLKGAQKQYCRDAC